jgi:triosephosphate isomerase
MTLTDVCGFIENAKFHLVGKERGVALVCGGSLNNDSGNHDLLSSEPHL